MQQGGVRLAKGAVLLAAGMAIGAVVGPRLLPGAADSGRAAAGADGAADRKAGGAADDVELPEGARAAPETVAELADRARVAEAARAVAEARVETLAADLAAARQEAAQVTAELAEANRALEPATGGPPIAFSHWGELDELRGVDWAEAGQAVHDMTGNVLKLMDEDAELDDAAKMALQIAIAKGNTKLQKIALDANGKLPTHGTGNGEFTHPIVFANLLLEQLAAAGEPLDEVQREDVARLGEQYDIEWHFLQRGYGPDTPLLRKLLDEVELKRRFQDRVEPLLTATQRQIAFPPQTRHLFYLDLHSPALLLVGRAEIIAKPTFDEVRAELAERLASRYGFQQAELPPAPLDAWAAALGPRLAPVPADRAAFFHIDDGIAAGHAQLALIDALLQVADADQRKKLLERGGLFVPRLVVGD